MNERQAYASIRNAIRLENLSESIAAPVGKQLRVIFDELKQQFRNMPPGNIERELWYRQQRLRILDMVTPLSRSAGADMAAAMDEEVYKQMEYAQDILDSVDEAAILAPQNAVSALGPKPTSKVEFTRQQLHTIAQDTTVLGDKLGDLFRPDLDDHGKHGRWIEQNIDLIDKKVKTGFLTGQTNEQIAAELPGLGRQAVSRNKAIARTAVMDMSARSQEALWIANSDRIKGWEYDATLDNRVCDRCAPWDGITKTVRGQLPSLPLHVNCRCRVLPLTATELALREKEGPQRRSVIELVDAKTKEGALAKVKVQKNVVGARAYASQVKVDGKKYWRVAKDIKQADHPLTMAEFLQQASPATQKQVLGSAKRRSKFIKLIAGSENRPPITPERALKEVVEWKPTVTRRPRVSMDMRMEISKLKSQKELMKKNSEGENHIVYGYLGKDGKPTYIGIGNDGGRPYAKHPRSSGAVVVPSDERRIRQFGVFPDRASAAKREQQLIGRYGRKGYDKGGILDNIKSGGGDALSASTRSKISAARKGKKLSKEHRTKLAAAKRGRKLSEETRKKMSEAQRRRQGPLKAKPAPVSKGDKARSISLAKASKGAALAGMTTEKYVGLSKTMQSRYRKAVARGYRGEELREVVKYSDVRIYEMARKLGIPPSVYEGMKVADRSTVRKRYNRGKRGAALLEGIL